MLRTKSLFLHSSAWHTPAYAFKNELYLCAIRNLGEHYNKKSKMLGDGYGTYSKCKGSLNREEIGRGGTLKIATCGYCYMLTKV